MPKNSKLTDRAVQVLQVLGEASPGLVYDDLSWIDGIVSLLKRNHWDYTKHLQKKLQEVKGSVGSTFHTYEVEGIAFATILNSGNNNLIHYLKEQIRDMGERLVVMRINEYYHSHIRWSQFTTSVNDDEVNKLPYPLVSNDKKKQFFVSKEVIYSRILAISIANGDSNSTAQYYNLLKSEFGWSAKKLSELAALVTTFYTTAKVLI